MAAATHMHKSHRHVRGGGHTGVGDGLHEVADGEGLVRTERRAPLLTEGCDGRHASGVLLIEQLTEGRVRAPLAQPALLIQQREHSVRLRLDGGDAFGVVGDVDYGHPRQLLRCVLLLGAACARATALAKRQRGREGRAGSRWHAWEGRAARAQRGRGGGAGSS